jgi:hypothetical protein
MPEKLCLSKELPSDLPDLQTTANTSREASPRVHLAVNYSRLPVRCLRTAHVATKGERKCNWAQISISRKEAVYSAQPTPLMFDEVSLVLDFKFQISNPVRNSATPPVVGCQLVTVIAGRNLRHKYRFTATYK